MPLQPGLTHELSIIISRDMTIDFLGEEVAPVYSTPAMIWDMEEAARLAIQPHLAEGQASVGVRINVKHLAATPIGKRVTVRATVTAIDRRRVTFAVEAYDEVEQIGVGTIERFIIDVAKFATRVGEKV